MEKKPLSRVFYDAFSDQQFLNIFREIKDQLNWLFVSSHTVIVIDV